ncbi:MAG TPA: substrate-binding domain-containing protein [Bacillota bacterium]|nr:substrate-binding domain-containing protein [Bacillota bacterium]HPT88308.1 substrate-binding domain-containing protein [Bacillota bacterium]
MRPIRIIPAISLILAFFAALIAFKATHWFWEDTAMPSTSLNTMAYRYHFVMIAHNTEETYWKQVHTGALSVARNADSALEYFSSRFLNLKELERYLEMAILSSVDGILISIPNQPELTALITEAFTKEIPIVSLSNSLETHPRLSYVGISAQNLGYQSGMALKKAAVRKIRAAVLINSNFSTESYQNYLHGFHRAIGSDSNIRLEMVVNSKGESISAEEQTQQILKHHPHIQAIICTDPNDTLGVAKVVVDQNRVSQTLIIGCGLTEEIANYIKREVIWGVLAEDPNELGAQGINTLIRLKTKNAEQEIYNLPLFWVDKSNVNQIYSKFSYTARRKNP